MSARGFNAASLSQLQQETGLPGSVIYYYFGSKAGLLSAVMEWGTQQFFTDLASEWDSVPEDASPRERLRGNLRLLYEVIERREEFLRLLLILLLTGETPEAVQAVSRVRSRGRAETHARIVAAFSCYGSSAATSVADTFADLAFASIEGAFLSRVGAGPEFHRRLFEQVMDGIAVLGEAHVAGLRAETT